jgi:hypothetical protein
MLPILKWRLTEQHGKIPPSIANSAKHQFDYREKEEFHVEKKSA